MNDMCRNCKKLLNHTCAGEGSLVYSNCVMKEEHHETKEFSFADGAIRIVWYLIDRNVDHIRNILNGERCTGLTYRGVSAEDTRYMVFSN